MIRTSRRAVLGGAGLGLLAVPTLSGVANWNWRHGDARLLLHDPSLNAGRRFAQAGAAQGAPSRAIEGDRIRFAREVLASKPALIAGVSRHADMLLIADVAAEAGYVEAAQFHARMGRCRAAQCRPGWDALGRLGQAAGAGWVEALAGFAADPRASLANAAGSSGLTGRDAGMVLGWVLVPRG